MVGFEKTAEDGPSFSPWLIRGEYVVDQLLGLRRAETVDVYVPRPGVSPAEVRRALQLTPAIQVNILVGVDHKPAVNLDHFALNERLEIVYTEDRGAAQPPAQLPSVQLVVTDEIDIVTQLRLLRLFLDYPELEFESSLRNRLERLRTHIREEFAMNEDMRLGLLQTEPTARWRIQSPYGRLVRAIGPSSKGHNNVLSISSYTESSLERLFDLTDQVRKEPGRFANALRGKIVAMLFFEPSTRTALSFQAAAIRLGAGVISNQELSLAKGESLADTLRIVSSMADAVVLRHSGQTTQDLIASCDVPLINAGDGAGDHPTQALLDLYTIRAQGYAFESLDVVVGFDPRHSRTEQSFLEALAIFAPMRVTTVAPPECQLSDEQLARFAKLGLSIDQTDLVGEMYRHQIAYVNRLQDERWSADLLPNLERLRGEYRLTAAGVAGSAIRDILDPLPRVHEVGAEVDSLPAASYFRQASLGVSLRMGLLLDVLL